MSTPNSNATTYCTATEFLKRYDARSIGDLCSDLGKRIDPTTLLTDPNLAAALNDASGLVEMACLKGQRYQPADLAGLTGVSQAALFRLVSDLAFGLIVQRRPDKLKEMPRQFELAMNLLDELASGNMIFGLVEVQLAGLMEHTIEKSQDVQNRALTPILAGRYFGTRGNQYADQSNNAGALGGGP